MARFSNKNTLKVAIHSSYEKLISLINAIPSSHREKVFTFDISNEKGAHWKRDKNIRDVLIHLYEWQILLIDWVKSNEAGIDKPFLPVEYNWKTYGLMNIEIWKKHQSTSFQKSISLLNQSHLDTIDILDSIDDHQLFLKGTYAGGSTIGQYFISATVGHYDWAIKKIKKHSKLNPN